MLNLPEIVTQEQEDKFFRNISRNIKEIRKAKKMSQLEVALSIGQQSSGFYAHLENYAHGKHFNLGHLLRLSVLFEVPIEEFFKINEEEPS